MAWSHADIHAGLIEAAASKNLKVSNRGSDGAGAWVYVSKKGCHPIRAVIAFNEDADTDRFDPSLAAVAAERIDIAQRMMLMRGAVPGAAIT